MRSAITVKVRGVASRILKKKKRNVFERVQCRPGHFMKKGTCSMIRGRNLKKGTASDRLFFVLSDKPNTERRKLKKRGSGGC